MEPIIIIGAPRSGTNMLRNALIKISGVATWPCDEINYIWRHGNVRYPSDEFTPQMVHPVVKRYVRRQFDWVARHYGAQIVIEKTCANSLRVPFVNAVIPEARYIFLVRDGRDAIPSAMKRWTAELDIPYLFAKVRFMPFQDLPYYGLKYFGHRIYRFFSKERRLGSWGPRLDVMNKILKQHTLDEVCALQWQACVETAEAAFSTMGKEKVFQLRYEDIVRNPAEKLSEICEWLRLPMPDGELESICEGISPRSVGKGLHALSSEMVARIENLVGSTLKRYGYIE